MNEANACPHDINKNKENLYNDHIKDDDGKREMEIVNDSKSSDKDEELYGSVDVVQTAEKMTIEGRHNDEYNLEGNSEHIEYNSKIPGESYRDTFAKCKQKTAPTETDADDPGFV